MKPIPMFFKAVTPAKPKPEPVKEAEQPAGDQPSAGGSDIVAHEPDMGHFSELLSLLSERGAGGGDFGAHNVGVGHHVAFAAGSFSGAGKVSAVGRDGVHVTDSTNREHRVHWREITGHYPGAGSDVQEGAAKGKDAV